MLLVFVFSDIPSNYVPDYCDLNLTVGVIVLLLLHGAAWWCGVGTSANKTSTQMTPTSSPKTPTIHTTPHHKAESNRYTDLHWVRALRVPMNLGLIDGPFVPHNLISAQESPVPLP